MLRNLAKILWLSLLLVVGLVGVYIYREQFSAQRHLARLEEEKRTLSKIITRLTSDKRVAEVLVTRQSTDEQGVLKTDLLFVEYGPDGNALPAKQFTVEGKNVHVDALVIKFEHDFVKAEDPLRGHSLALFKSIYGDRQAPATAPAIDTPGKIPAFYRGTDPVVSDFETELWSNFWRLADDENYRKAKGVRVAQGEAVFLPFQPDRLYTIKLETNGGLNMTSEPVKGIYQEALKRTPS
jgi:hypothetical protein